MFAENPPGPVQSYCVPPVALSCSDLPSQTGLLPETVVTGRELIRTLITDENTLHVTELILPASVTANL